MIFFVGECEKYNLEYFPNKYEKIVNIKKIKK